MRRRRRDHDRWSDLAYANDAVAELHWSELAADIQREAVNMALASDDPVLVLPSGDRIPAWLAPTGERP